VGLQRQISAIVAAARAVVGLARLRRECAAYQKLLDSFPPSQPGRPSTQADLVANRHAQLRKLKYWLELQRSLARLSEPS
jgi:hypothetical protein